MSWRAVAIGLLSTAVAAQSQWTLQGASARVRVSGPMTRWLQGPRATDTLPAGDYDVHFGVDATGKPRSLHLSVPDGGVVFVATEGGAAAMGDAIQTMSDVRGHPQCAGDPDAANYRVTMSVAAGADAVGLVARCTDGRQFYRFVWDPAATEFRLERSLGGDVLVLARAVAPPADEARHTLALQVDGFRLEACWDEAVVLQLFDGALSTGAVGVWASPTSAPILCVAQQPVAKPKASAALVATDRGARFAAAVTVVPGHLYVLELALDRAQPELPLTAGGFEPWLVLPPAGPVVLWADWRGSIGAHGFGEVGPDGMFAGELRWPELTALRKQCALLRAVLVSADGDSATARTPGVRLLFP
jgi:hypothetical protein